MSCRLRSYDISPPGGYPYEQTVGIPRKFPSQPMIEAQAQLVSSFRKANGLPRSSVKESLEDVDQYTCARLGCMPGFCVSVTQQGVVAMAATAPAIAPPCKGCGAPVQS